MNNIKQTRPMIAAATVAILAAISSAASADTNSVPRKLTLSIYLDAVGSAALLAGNYSAAAKKIESNAAPDHATLYISHTNLCVAYTMSHQWDAAQSNCDAAVSDARVRGPDDMFDHGAGQHAQMATAYSNRAVLNWLQNKPQNALADVAKAHSMAPKATFVTDNWVTMNAPPADRTGPVVAAVQR